jgi:hypothetical protein
MPDVAVKRGDAKTLVFDLGRDLAGVASATVRIAETIGGALAVSRAGVISDVPNGIVQLGLLTSDYAVGKLEAGKQYYMEVETLPGPLTHPDIAGQPYLILVVLADLG